MLMSAKWLRRIESYNLLFIYFRYYFIQARDSVIGTYNHIVMNLQR